MYKLVILQNMNLYVSFYEQKHDKMYSHILSQMYVLIDKLLQCAWYQQEKEILDKI